MGLIQSLQANFLTAVIVTLVLVIGGAWIALKSESRLGWVFFALGLLFLISTMRVWGLF